MPNGTAEGLGLSVPDNGKLLSYWAKAAFAARCARHYAAVYTIDPGEPASARTAVAEAVALAEISAGLGGGPDASGRCIQIEAQFFDHYDVAALGNALGAFWTAAANTLSDLSECNTDECTARRNVAAIALAGNALRAAFPSVLESTQSFEPQEVLAMMCEGGCEELAALGVDDLACIIDRSTLEHWNKLQGVAQSTFERNAY